MASEGTYLCSVLICSLISLHVLQCSSINLAKSELTSASPAV